MGRNELRELMFALSGSAPALPCFTPCPELAAQSPGLPPASCRARKDSCGAVTAEVTAAVCWLYVSQSPMSLQCPWKQPHNTAASPGTSPALC